MFLENNNQAAVMLKNLLQELDECGQTNPHVRYNNLKPSYFGWPKQSDLKEFRSEGYDLIKINEAVKLVMNALRFDRLICCFL